MRKDDVVGPEKPQAPYSFPGIDQFLRGAKGDARRRIESVDHGWNTAFTGLPDEDLYQGLMAAMNSVKGADGHHTGVQ